MRGILTVSKIDVSNSVTVIFTVKLVSSTIQIFYESSFMIKRFDDQRQPE